MNIQPINSNNYQQHNQVVFQSRLKSLNVINPISRYMDIYFNKMAKLSQNTQEEVSLGLVGKVKILRLNKGKSTEISAWDINPNNYENYVLFLHGMSQNVSNYQRLYESIIPHNTGILAVEYRGYGANKSVNISEDRLRSDVERAYEFLIKEKKVKPENITVMGHSMGGALAANFASKHNDIRSLILICPITNMADVGKKFIMNNNVGMGIPKRVKEFTDRMNPLKWLYNLRFNSLNKMDKVEVPTYIIQSQNDTVTLLGGARKLAKKAKRKGILKDFALLPSGGHKVDMRKVSKISEVLSKIYGKAES